MSFIRKISSGLLLLKGRISVSEERAMAAAALKKGGLTFTDDRGRKNDALSNYPEIYTMVAKRTLEEAVRKDDTFREVLLTHCITSYYRCTVRPPQDDGADEQGTVAPIVSFAVGDACDLLITQEQPVVAKGGPPADPKSLVHRIRLESGDALVFNRAYRYMWRGISTFYPAESELPSRHLNFTFLHTPELLGKEGH